MAPFPEGHTMTASQGTPRMAKSVCRESSSARRWNTAADRLTMGDDIAKIQLIITVVLMCPQADKMRICRVNRGFGKWEAVSLSIRAAITKYQKLGGL